MPPRPPYRRAALPGPRQVGTRRHPWWSIATLGGPARSPQTGGCHLLNASGEKVPCHRRGSRELDFPSRTIGQTAELGFSPVSGPQVVAGLRPPALRWPRLLPQVVLRPRPRRDTHWDCGFLLGCACHGGTVSQPNGSNVPADLTCGGSSEARGGRLDPPGSLGAHLPVLGSAQGSLLLVLTPPAPHY